MDSSADSVLRETKTFRRTTFVSPRVPRPDRHSRAQTISWRQGPARSWSKRQRVSNSTSKYGPVCHTASSRLKLMFCEAQKSRVNGMQLNSLQTSHSYTGTL